MILNIESCETSKTGKSLILKAGGQTYFAKPDSGIRAGMTIEAETKVSEYNGKTNTWVEKWKAAANAPAPAQASAAASGLWCMPFISNVCAHAIQAGLIKEPADLSMWANAAMSAANELEGRPY